MNRVFDSSDNTIKATITGTASLDSISAGTYVISTDIHIPAVNTAQGSLDPGTWFDSDDTIWILDLTTERFPNGIIINNWAVDCNVADPDVEMNINLMSCDAIAGGIFPASIDGSKDQVLDIMDTTTGNSSETDRSNIANSGAIATDKSIYISFDADPEGTCTQMHFRLNYWLPNN